MSTKDHSKPADNAGHLDPQRAKSLLERSHVGESDPDPRGFLAGKKGRKHEELAEELGENFVASATAGEEAEPERRDRTVTSEMGGPFVATSARTEFARGADASNPPDGEQEPFPTPNHGK